LTPGGYAWSDLRAVKQLNIHYTHLRAILVGCLAILLALFCPRLALAQDPPGVVVPAGQTAVTFAWAGEASLVVITQAGTSYNVFRVELADSKWLPVAMPPSFTKLKAPGKNGLAVDIALSADGNGLAVLEHALEPLIAPALSVYRWTANGYRAVDTRQVPEQFWPAHLAWDEHGQMLYMAAREYLFPEQLYSVGALDAASGQFSNVMLKGNIDLVDELAYLPQRQALAVRSRGFQGEYPQEPVISLIELAAKQFFILHSEATGHELLAMANGELVVLGPPVKPGQPPAETWVLKAGDRALSPADFAQALAQSTLQSTADGRWQGFIIAESANTGQPGALLLQRVADGQSLATGQACAMFAFAPNNRYVCALNADRTGFTFYQLPTN
jgi:hypothetical protein